MQPLQLRIVLAGMGWCQELVDQGLPTVRPSPLGLVAAALWVCAAKRLQRWAGDLMQADHMLLLVSHPRLLPAVRSHSKCISHLGIGQRWFVLVLPTFLKPCSFGVQVAEAPWDAQASLSISPEMQDLACGQRHDIAADAGSKPRIELFSSADESELGFLQQILVFTTATAVLALGS